MGIATPFSGSARGGFRTPVEDVIQLAKSQWTEWAYSHGDVSCLFLHDDAHSLFQLQERADEFASEFVNGYEFRAEDGDIPAEAVISNAIINLMEDVRNSFGQEPRDAASTLIAILECTPKFMAMAGFGTIKAPAIQDSKPTTLTNMQALRNERRAALQMQPSLSL